MNLILFDNWRREHLLPLTFTRTAADMRIGILTIREKWEIALNTPSFSLTENYLQAKFPLQTGKDNLLVAGALLPNDELVAAIRDLAIGQALYQGNDLLALRTEELPDWQKFYLFFLKGNRPVDFVKRNFHGDCHILSRPFHLFQYNEEELERDFQTLTRERKSQPLSPTNVVIGNPDRIFVEEGASIENATLNTREGCIYIGKDAEVMEGCRLRGPFALCEHAVTKMDAKIYGATTIGPYSKVGGELSNVVVFGFSNKAHDGFIGNSVIGEWCNLGADTNSSNLKNNYSTVRLWNYATRSMEDTHLQFCGLIMGDYSRCGICTMFNTGTTIGVSSCLYGGGLHPKFVPSFSFGSPTEGYVPYQLDKVFATAEIVFQRRHKIFDIIEQNILTKVNEITHQES